MAMPPQVDIQDSHAVVDNKGTDMVVAQPAEGRRQSVKVRMYMSIAVGAAAAVGASVSAGTAVVLWMVMYLIAVDMNFGCTCGDVGDMQAFDSTEVQRMVYNVEDPFRSH